MGAILSSTTIYATAYLTELGRSYLFNSTDNPRYITLANGQTIDRLKIERFSLSDDDVNYNISTQLASGDIPDISGENESAVKGAKGRTLSHLISPGETTLLKDTIDTVEYKVTQNEIVWDMAKNRALLPSVVTQQLMTYVDGLLVSDGVYDVNPTNYGKINVKNAELIIPIKEPTSVAAGYRLRIYFPKTGVDYNKMVFQFEKSNALQQVVVTNTTVQVIATPTTTSTVATASSNIVSSSS